MPMYNTQQDVVTLPSGPTRYDEPPSPLERTLIMAPRDGIKSEDGGVLNPTVIDGHMVYRTVEAPNHSTLSYARLENGEVVYRPEKPILSKPGVNGHGGCEDPRIVRIEDLYDLFFTDYDGKIPKIVWGVTAELNERTRFEMQGPISPQVTVRQACEWVDIPELAHIWSKMYESSMDSIIPFKNFVPIPERIRGELYFRYRIEPGIRWGKCNSFKELGYIGFWEHSFKTYSRNQFMNPEERWQWRKMGSGGVALKTEYGWLEFPHGVEENGKKVYRIGMTLSDLEHPEKLLKRSKGFLFEPVEDWEINGIVNNVVFATASERVIKIIDGKPTEVVRIYYGAADKFIGKIAYRKDDLIRSLGVDITTN